MLFPTNAATSATAHWTLTPDLPQPARTASSSQGYFQRALLAFCFGFDIVIMRSQHSEGALRREKPKFRVKEWSSSIKEEENEALKMHVYNFFITEGHHDLAQSFAKEAGLTVPVLEEEPINKRLRIKNLIRSSEFQAAIREIEGTGRAEEERAVELIFTVKCLKVIHLIREQRVEEAIASAKELLIPYVKKKFDWIEKVEQVMSLIAFADEKQCANRDLLHPSYKNKVADEVNTFLLGDSSKETLKVMLNLGKWLEKRLDIYATFPHINPWGHELFQP